MLYFAILLCYFAFRKGAIMFDKNALIYSEFKTPVTNKNFKNFLPKYSLNFDHKILKSPELLHYYLPAENCKYSISGKSYVLKPKLLSPLALSSLLYVQNFGLFYADKNYYTERSNCDSYMILFTYAGEGTLHYGNKSYTLHSGDGFFIDCNDIHSYQASECGWTHSVLHFYGNNSSIFFKEYLKCGNIIFSEPANGTYHTLLEHLVSTYEKVIPHRELCISNLLTNILTHLVVDSANAKSANPALKDSMQKAVQYMEEHFSEDLSLDFLADYSSVSKFHFSREFHKYTGLPPMEYLIQLRMNQIKLLLTTTNLPANKIAASVGILNEQHFNKLFKKKIGMTPGKYREKYAVY